MKRAYNIITPVILILAYSIIAGGSAEKLDVYIGVGIGVAFGLFILISVIAKIYSDRNTSGILEEMKQEFGDYTEAVEYECDQFILYDEKSNRIRLKDSVIDSRKIKDLRVYEQDPEKTTTYQTEKVIRTDTKSALARGIIGSFLAGDAGAIIGGSTADKRIEVRSKEVPSYTKGFYAIEVIDDQGKVRETFMSESRLFHDPLVVFFKKIIYHNTKEERESIEAEKAANLKKIESTDTGKIVLGCSKESIENILINSKRSKHLNGRPYVLDQAALNVINKSWNSIFEDVFLTFRDGILIELFGVSRRFKAKYFNNIIIEASKVADIISKHIGSPSSVTESILLTQFSDDNTDVEAYKWENGENQESKINIVYDKGEFYYSLIQRMIKP